jgi:APA family basic amino acid/polyamine antiporter
MTVARGEADDDAKRRLSVFGAMSLVAGSMLGIGIFISPPVVAAQIDRPGAFLFIWLLGGLTALFGALSVAELGSMMPRAGGDYPYLKLAYGPGLAFAVGWLQLLAVFPGSLAAMAVGTAEYQLPMVLGGAWGVPAEIGLSPIMFWAIAIVVLLTAVNHIGVVVSGRLQIVVTVVPVVVLLIGTLAVLLHQGTEGGALANAGHDMRLPAVGGFALAYLKVYFAYSGWNAAIYVGGEIRRPGRNLPRALVGGTLGVTVLYLVLCVGFLAVFTMDDLAHSGEAGTAAAEVIFGRPGKILVTLSILFCMLGSMNGTILTGSRISFAMAQGGHCIASAGKTSERHGTPVIALWLQAAWTILLMFTHKFEQLIDYASAAMLISGTMTVVAVFVLRRRLRDAPRPYRTWGYPITPALYVISSVAVLFVLLSNQDPSVFLAVAWFLGAWLFHRLFMQNRGT